MKVLLEAIETSDLNIDNLKVITKILTETSRLIRSRKLSLEVISEVRIIIPVSILCKLALEKIMK